MEGAVEGVVEGAVRWWWRGAVRGGERWPGAVARGLQGAAGGCRGRLGVVARCIEMHLAGRTSPLGRLPLSSKSSSTASK